MVDEKEAEQEIARIRQRLTALDAERVELEIALATLEQKLTSIRLSDKPSLFVDAPITNNSSSADKVALFRSLFAGRPDLSKSESYKEDPKASKGDHHGGSSLS